MLENDPPPGTSVVLLQEIKTPRFRTLKAYEAATLVRALEKYPVDKPGDLFEIESQGERVTVRRDQIRKA